MVPIFYGPIYKGIFTNICSLWYMVHTIDKKLPSKFDQTVMLWLCPVQTTATTSAILTEVLSDFPQSLLFNSLFAIIQLFSAVQSEVLKCH
jgi:hypothetical protein